ncbi:MAG: hypothetical protein GY846_13620 [Deltaproteobacteria bacterium]|nr:hypothetical protein [Deltaproteobacteria bacterium]
MAWIETIRISLGRGSRGEESMRLLEMMEAELALLESGQWEFYRNPAVKEDLMMVLHWESNPNAPSGSDLALMLVQELKKEGLVEHTVWEDVREEI